MLKLNLSGGTAKTCAKVMTSSTVAALEMEASKSSTSEIGREATSTLELVNGKMGTRTPKWDKNGSKVETKWKQEWEQSGNTKPTRMGTK